uniref:F-box domain-containing protein n=1 Tax=Steinernema glaseri TaxID=37863 RepID=A0A1I7YV40_9BILA
MLVDEQLKEVRGTEPLAYNCGIRPNNHGVQVCPSPSIFGPAATWLYLRRSTGNSQPQSRASIHWSFGRPDTFHPEAMPSQAAPPSSADRSPQGELIGAAIALPTLSAPEFQVVPRGKRSAGIPRRDVSRINASSAVWTLSADPFDRIRRPKLSPSIRSTVSLLSDASALGWLASPDPCLRPAMWPELSDAVIAKILGFLPLKERIRLASALCKRYQKLAKESLRSVAFFREQLDALPDAKLREFLSQYSTQVDYVNLDLYRAVQHTSQGGWRQSIYTVSGICRNLRTLDILVCDRHKLRDTDMIKIFKNCPKLKTVRMDAQFITGYCFMHAPSGLTRVELEMCFRLSSQAFGCILGLKKLRHLYVSQLLILTDQVVAEMTKKLHLLTDLSIVSHPDSKYESLTGAGLAQLRHMKRLKILCLEGLPAVTDRFLHLFTGADSLAMKSITDLSLAFCYNLSSDGLSRLSLLNQLSRLNLDGILKRDISSGLSNIANRGQLQKLLVADGVQLSPDLLLDVVSNNKELCFLDLSNSRTKFGVDFVKKLLEICSEGRRRALYVLTDSHEPWSKVTRPEENQKLFAYHLHRPYLSRKQVSPNSLLSDDLPIALPSGILAPNLRRGNRYRSLWAPLGPSNEPRLQVPPGPLESGKVRKRDWYPPAISAKKLKKAARREAYLNVANGSKSPVTLDIQSTNEFPSLPGDRKPKSDENVPSKAEEYFEEEDKTISGDQATFGDRYLAGFPPLYEFEPLPALDRVSPGPTLNACSLGEDPLERLFGKALFQL